MPMPFARLLFAWLMLLASAAAVAGPAISVAPKPRVIVLTDIGNEPDDSESLVRFLLYTDQFDVEGLVAATSVWQRDHVRTDLIAERIDAYAAVRANLIRHDPAYPSAAALRSMVRAGTPLYGMAGVGDGHDSAASRLIVGAVDRADTRPVWVLAWGGVVDLAQALWTVRAQRSPEQLRAFIAKLRVYSISDQDDAGPWLRRTFPDLFWIASIHGWGQYNMAAWSGISGDRLTAERWPDREMVLDPWLATNVRRGPLGELYPLPAFIMEGDAPSFLYLIPTGLGDAEHPDWGGWGGRYMRAEPDGGLYADTKDIFVRDGALWAGNQATVYRWRGAFQNDFAARIGWTLTPHYNEANHPPVVTIAGAAGLGAVRLSGRSGESLALDAMGTRDPDGDALSYRWWQYREVGGIPPQPPAVIEAPNAARTRVTLPVVTKPTVLHLILEVRDAGTPPLTRYRRVIIDMQP
ncbi:DUF1593 domain-containing protein [Sphingomonas sp. YR710]|uniref:DUF1593 domain-containing protein n=1 Tax=Sphingomonas sp. YR710 TaxID=1882773 RepID=UPI001C40B919|nr:DUF1593 domain-containing protein [Sphingomonas sp. YR710]